MSKSAVIFIEPDAAASSTPSRMSGWRRLCSGLAVFYGPSARSARRGGAGVVASRSRRRGGRRSPLGPLGMFSALHEPSEFDVREALRILFGLKGEDGLVVIDGHNDSVRYCPCRILPRCYFNAEGHPLSRALRQASHGHGGRGSLVEPAQTLTCQKKATLLLSLLGSGSAGEREP